MADGVTVPVTLTVADLVVALGVDTVEGTVGAGTESTGSM